MTDFATLIRVLADAGVEFILVGGVAATVHGSARLTRDVDVVYARTPENIQRVVAALASHAPYWTCQPSFTSSAPPVGLGIWKPSPNWKRSPRNVPGASATPIPELSPATADWRLTTDD